MSTGTASNPPSSDPRGYRRLALLEGSLPEIAVFKKFRVIHADDLNLLQAEIVNVDAEFRRACAAHEYAPDNSDHPPYESMRILQTLSRGPKSPYSLYKKRQKLLETYGNALLRYRTIERLPQINPHNFTALREWYDNQEGGGGGFRHGLEDAIWEDEADLTCLSRSDDAVDGLLLRVRDYIVSSVFWLFKDKSQRHTLPLRDPMVMSKPLETPLVWFPEKKITAILNVISTILASILPAISIFALIFVRSLLVRVGIILVFTLTFVVIMAMLGKAKRPEIWAVSAAFNAVLVVFVGSLNASAHNTDPQ